MPVVLVDRPHALWAGERLVLEPLDGATRAWLIARESTVISSTEHANVGIIICKALRTPRVRAGTRRHTSVSLESTVPHDGLRMPVFEASFGQARMDLTTDLWDDLE